MTRSVTGTPLHRRLSRTAALFAAFAAALWLLPACGAGQRSQTGTMVPPVAGIEANSRPHGQAALRNVQIQYNNPQGYGVGATAPLSLYIANNDPRRPLVLRDVTAASRKSGKQLGSVVLIGGAGGESGPASPSAGGSMAGERPALTIPPNGHQRLSPGAGPYLAITEIAEPLQPGSSAVVTFRFEGEAPLTVAVPFGTPLSPPPPASVVPSVRAPAR